MNRASRQLTGAPLLLLIVLLFVAVALVVQNNARRSGTEIGPESAAPEGHLLLNRWLGEMGYRISLERDQRLPSAQDHLTILFPGRITFRTAEAEELLAWVEQGGRLAIFGATDRTLRQVLDFQYRSLPFSRADNQVVQTQPFMPSAQAEWGDAGRLPTLEPGENGASVSVLAETPGGAATVSLLQRGEGQVWLFSKRYPFSNERLLENPEDAHLMVLLLQNIPENGRIRFDTYHLFGGEEQETTAPATLREWLYRTPVGWSLLFLAGLTLLYLFLEGRRLGPPIEEVSEARRREASEFVVAMAGLQRRSRSLDSVARYHHRRIKRTLGRRANLSAELEDSQFVTELGRSDPRWQGKRGEELARILTGLSALPSESHLIEYLAEADRLLPESVDAPIPH